MSAAYSAACAKKLESAPTVIRRKGSRRVKRALTGAPSSKHLSWPAPLSTRARTCACLELVARGREGFM